MPEAFALEGHSVVLVDDDAIMIDLLTQILIHTGMRVRSALTGAEGLELVLQDVPDLAIIDLIMPGMDGWEVFRQIRSKESTRLLPVIILTGSMDSNYETHAAPGPGAKSMFLAKPISPPKLIESVQEILSASHA